MAGATSKDPQWDDFRIHAAAEIQGLLQRVINERCLVSLSGPQGQAFMTLLHSYDLARGTLTFSADDGDTRLDALLEAGELVAVAYLDRIKVQFDIDGAMLVDAAGGRQLRTRLPGQMYRFQRREAFRVQPLSQQVPVAHFHHPGQPQLELHLRVLDLSLGGVGLFLPDNLPMVPAGVTVHPCRLELDDQTALTVKLLIHHVTAIHPQTRGVRLGCELLDMERDDRSLGLFINQTQKRRAALSAERR